jgi:tRNA G18 (ribose-2'-O)-methylase SpoU
LTVDTADLVEIDDPGDPRVADYVRLTDPELRRLRESSDGAEGGFFIAEGVTVIRALLESPYAVRSLFVTPLRWAALASSVPAGVTVYVAAQEVLNEVAGFPLHRGALASAGRLPMRPVASVVDGCGLVVATEGVNDHENLGSLFRNAAAFGAGAVLLDPTSCDPLYRRAVRVSMGHVLRVPFTRWAGGAVGVAELRRLGFEVVALTPAADAEDVAGLGPPPGGVDGRVLLLGAEGPGLGDELLGAADRRVRIPMAAGVDSINVAAATAVALHRLASLPFG